MLAIQYVQQYLFIQWANLEKQFFEATKLMEIFMSSTQVRFLYLTFRSNLYSFLVSSAYLSVYISTHPSLTLKSLYTSYVTSIVIRAKDTRICKTHLCPKEPYNYRKEIDIGNNQITNEKIRISGRKFTFKNFSLI